MICNNCGTHMPEGAGFCGVCGMTMQAQETKKKSKWLPILLCVLGIAIVGAVLLLLLQTKSPEQFARDYVSAILEGDAEALVEFYHEYDDDYSDAESMESLVYHNIDDYEIKRVEAISVTEVELEEYNAYYSEENPGYAIQYYGEEVDDIYRVVYSFTAEYKGVEYDGIGELSLVEIDGEYYIDTFNTAIAGYLNFEPDFYKNYKD